MKLVYKVQYLKITIIQHLLRILPGCEIKPKKVSVIQNVK